MKLTKVGFVGWRGMVGSVLLQRMNSEDDFARIPQPVFFSTSQVGQPGPEVRGTPKPLEDAHDLDALARMDAIVTCQGGDYTRAVHGELRVRGWDGYWIDAASTLRMAADSTIVLDPVNLPVIQRALAAGKRDFCGGNCTVSSMMLALNGLLNADLVEWVSVATYQAISGGGAQQMRELLAQMGANYKSVAELLRQPDASILDIDAQVSAKWGDADFATAHIGYPLAGNLLPWVDSDLGDGVSREEWKGGAELNKILAREHAPIPVESTCVRVGVLRSHSQAMTIRLNKNLPLEEVSDIIAGGNAWVKLIPNQREASLTHLTPAAVSGSLDIAVGRLRKLGMGESESGMLISAFTVGDQLLWGAAEPLRRALRIIMAHSATQPD